MHPKLFENKIVRKASTGLRSWKDHFPDSGCRNGYWLHLSTQQSRAIRLGEAKIAYNFRAESDSLEAEHADLAKIDQNQMWSSSVTFQSKSILFHFPSSTSKPMSKGQNTERRKTILIN